MSEPRGAKTPLPEPVLCLITDRKRFGEGRLAEVVAAAVEGGVNVVQVREKDMPPDALLALARELREVTRGRVLLIVNGDPDVARAAGADGVHLPEHFGPFPDDSSSLSPSIRDRSTLASGASAPLLVGRSVHGVEGAKRAAALGADYLQAGHVFETGSHPGEPPRGTEWLKDLCAAVPLPVIAVGGIDASNAGACVRAGARGVAVISAVGAAEDPGRAAREIRASLQPLSPAYTPDSERK
jgi:thiamine-phosphate pyrophosphorylase